MSRSNQQPVKPKTITDRKHVMSFGRYKDETVQDILDNDPLYIDWLQENTDSDFAWDILEEARQGPKHTFTGFTARNDPR